MTASEFSSVMDNTVTTHSNNSLDIRNQSQVQSNTINNTPRNGTPTNMKGKVVPLGSQTAVADLLAMLDETSFSNISDYYQPHDFLINSSNDNNTSSFHQIIQGTSEEPTEDLSPRNILRNDIPIEMGLNIDAPLLITTPTKFDDTMSTSLSNSEHNTGLNIANQGYINPYLLNNDNISDFVDNGILGDDIKSSLIDEFEISPQHPQFSSDRRMSSVATSIIPGQDYSRNSISHQIDFWHLPNEKFKTSSLSLQKESSVSQSTTDNNDNIDLMNTFKKSPRLGSLSTGTSNFKIDNELTKLLNNYNLSFTQSPTPSSTNGGRIRAGSLNPALKSNNSILESKRVLKQRASMSLVDGNNQEILVKLYGDMMGHNSKEKLPNSWENAVVSDEDEDESAINRINGIIPQKHLISPAMLDNTSYDLGTRNISIISTSNQLTSIANPGFQQLKKKRSTFLKPRNTKSTSPLDEDEKPFKCQECPKAFRRSEHLKRHIRSVHSTERPFHCLFCDKKFSRSDNLSQHLKTHKKHGDIKELPPLRRTV